MRVLEGEAWRDREGEILRLGVASPRFLDGETRRAFDGVADRVIEREESLCLDRVACRPEGRRSCVDFEGDLRRLPGDVEFRRLEGGYVRGLLIVSLLDAIPCLVLEL